MTALDIDALHATWKAATAVPLSDWGRWINAITDAWPAIYERLRELEAERDDEHDIAVELASEVLAETARAERAEERLERARTEGE